MYIPKYFKLYELLPKEFYNNNKHLGNKLWLMFDERILITQDNLRKRYGPLVCNDWYWGGNNQYRGWRPFDCPIGANLSQHKFGRAVDPKPQKITAEEIRADLKGQIGLKHYPDITCIEDNVSWLHIDCRNWNKKENGLLIINP